jgi:hypothetical protein
MRSREKYIVHEGREFIYFVTQKVACTSIKTALLPLFDMDVSDFERTRPDGTRALRVHKLFDASEYQIGKEQLVIELDGKYRGFFKFAFVRNPWDRLLSCYFNKFARPNAPGLKAPANMDVELYAGMPFAEFVEAISVIPDRKANLHFRSQHAALCDPEGRVMADFVGRFENLEVDFRAVTAKLGLSERVELPHLLRSGIRKSRSYRDFYDNGLRELVCERYRKDVDLFGYQY